MYYHSDKKENASSFKADRIRTVVSMVSMATESSNRHNGRMVIGMILTLVLIGSLSNYQVTRTDGQA